MRFRALDTRLAFWVLSFGLLGALIHLLAGVEGRGGWKQGQEGGVLT